jgi:two-component system, cell cycle response regulator CpdR
MPLRGTAIVVEEDEIQRDMIALLLEESEFKVIQCDDAETASLALKTRHPSLLITDVNLAGRMTGIELVHFAHTIDPTLRVVVISGEPPAGPLPDGVTFLSKPIYPIALIREATH